MRGVTPEKMKEGFSKIRNRALANAFAYMNLIEKWGSGFPRILRDCRDYGLRNRKFLILMVICVLTCIEKLTKLLTKPQKLTKLLTKPLTKLKTLTKLEGICL